MTKPSQYLQKNSLFLITVLLVAFAVVSVVAIRGYQNFNGSEGMVHSDGSTIEATAEDSGQREIITLAGGCFWCIEAALQETPGVVDAISGYAGGTVDTATYLQVAAGKTEHREAVQVTYDPVRISTQKLLDVFWSHIDPTDNEGQFSDRGMHYIPAIFYHSPEQKQIAEASRSALDTSGIFNTPINTSILPYTTFFEAEEYHQDYYKKSSIRYEAYKKASGRTDFIDENWANEAALKFFKDQEKIKGTTSSTSAVHRAGDLYQERMWSVEEISAGLKKLSEQAYGVVVNNGTELPYINEYSDNQEAGIYVDVVTGRPLFSSTHKYNSGTGWPSFYQPINDKNIIYKADEGLLLSRTEVRSESGHLGHVFDDGPAEHGGKRYCLNSLALKFIPKADMEKMGYGDYLYLFQ